MTLSLILTLRSFGATPQSKCIWQFNLPWIARCLTLKPHTKVVLIGPHGSSKVGRHAFRVFQFQRVLYGESEGHVAANLYDARGALRVFMSIDGQRSGAPD